MSKTVVLADVARKSKVSLSTVSLVLRDKPGIPPETRSRVLAAAQDLGYRPRRRLPAKNGRSTERPDGKLHSLGLLVKIEPELTPQANPFYSQVLAGIEDACRHAKANLLYATLPVDDNNIPLEMPRLLSEQQVDGLLLVGAFADETLMHMFGQNALPVVLVDAYASIDHPYDAVLSDNFGGAYAAVRYLVEGGHQHIGLIGGPPGAYPSLRERREGYQQALRDRGPLPVYTADCPIARSAEAAEALLTQHPEITALFGCNDIIAINAMHAAQAVGRRVPGDLAIVGFDDIGLAQHVSPQLTTMHVDKVGMGRLAVQTLANRIKFPESERVISMIRPRLVERGSARIHA
jgi:LacI family transcriptional regulator